LIIEIEELKNSPDGKLNLEFNEYIPDIGNTEDVTGTICAELTSYGLKIQGNVSTNIDLTCDRCLEKFTRVVEIAIDEDYIFGTLVPQGVKEYELRNNDLDGDETIDITDLVYQAILLEQPSQILCLDDCKGNKDTQEAMAQISIDPRLEQFKTLSESQK